MSSETKPKIDMDPKYLAKLSMILLAFSAVVALLLGVVNGVTKDKIIAINAEKTAKAMSAVVEDASSTFEELDVGEAAVAAAAEFNKTKLVSLYEVKAGGETVGHVCQVITGGSQGDITMVVGTDATGAVTGTSIVKMSETSGLGTKANEDSWRAQFIGAAEPVAVDKDGGTIAALSGATVSSRAVVCGVNAAIAAVKTLG